MLVVKSMVKKYNRRMQHSSISPTALNISEFNEPTQHGKANKHTDSNPRVDVFAAGIVVDSYRTVVIQPNIIKTRRAETKSLIGELQDNASGPTKSPYQIELDTQKRVQRLRDQALLRQHNAPKKNEMIKKGSDNWKLIVAYSAAILLLLLLVGPFFGHVASALAAF